MSQENKGYLFKAPVAIQGDDEVTLYFGYPIAIHRNGNEVWSNTTWWLCGCGYSMPEPLETCVKCGESKPDMSLVKGLLK